MVTAPEKRSGGGEERNSSDNKSDLYRLFIIGKKSLPEVRKTEARVSEWYWARVGGIFKDANELTKEKKKMNSEEKKMKKMHDQLENESMQL